MVKEKEKEKALTKDRLIGMEVIGSDGYAVGEVKDIAFTVGKVGMVLVMETKDGETREIEWDEVQAAGDYVILKPKPAEAVEVPAVAAAPVTAQQICPTCRGPLTYIDQYKKWYCYRCQKYA